MRTKIPGAEQYSAGPASYHVEVNAREHCPAFSFKSRTPLLSRTQVTPGPAAYNADYKLVLRKTIADTTWRHPTITLTRHDDTPGPASYNNDRRDRGAAFSIKGRLSDSVDTLFE